MRLSSVVLLQVVLALIVNPALANEEWLESGLPPLKEATYEVVKVQITRNHVEQELLRAEIRRVGASTVRDPRAELKLVMLPAHGGRYAANAGRTLVVSPRREDTVGGVVGGMLNYRGEVALGARVYLELQTSSRTRTSTAPQRVSKVYWLGTNDQLTKAIAKGSPPVVQPGDRLKSRMVPVPPSTALPKGMIVKAELGGRVRPFTVWEDAAANEPITGLVYLSRPGKLLLPWIATVKRGKLKAEPEALEEMKNNPDFFAERFENVQSRLLRGKRPPLLLESVADKLIAVGDKLLAFKLGGLNSMEVLSPVSNGAVKVRGGRRQQESQLALAALYLDPEGGEPETAKKDRPTKTTRARPARTKSARPNSARAKREAAAAQRFRTWTDASGEFKVEAIVVKVVEGSITLRRKDGKEITVPLNRLSEADQKFVEQAKVEKKNPFDP